MNRFSCLCVYFVCIINHVNGQNDTLHKNSPVVFNATYIGDLVSNFSGGIKKGTTYLGLANIKAAFSTNKAKWWHGGEVFINIANTHGGKPTETLVGDFQGVSNIEAGNLTFLYELWYKQSFGNLDFKIGLQDLNADFALSENGVLFSNSSFGVQSSIADNISSPIFPLTALGANVHWKISNDYVLQAAVFDGTPDNFETNPYNLHWKLSKNQGFLAVIEFHLNKSLIADKTGWYKLGAYYHEHNDTVDVEQRNRGFYFVGDQQITRKLSVFSQIGLSPKSINMHNHYYSIGCNFNGLFSLRPNDHTGIAIAYAGIDGNAVGSEAAIELTYQFELNKYIYIRPDIQYILNPAGTDVKLNNALVGFVRVGVGF